MAFLIIFKVGNERTRQALVTAIAHYGNSIKLSESSYAVKTNQSATLIYDGLQLHLGRDDDLLVLPLERPYTGGNAHVRKWLDENLTGP